MDEVHPTEEAPSSSNDVDVPNVQPGRKNAGFWIIIGIVNLSYFLALLETVRPTTPIAEV